MIVKHYSNVLNRFYLEDLKKTIFSNRFTWVRHNETAGGYNGNFSWIEDENTEETDLFSHDWPKNYKDQSISTDCLVYAISEIMGYRIELERIKINLMMPKAKQNPASYNRPHVDYPEPGMKTFLFYLNDADGDTYLFDKTYSKADPGKLSVVEHVTPRENCAILFDSYRYHASSIPVNSKRVAINVVFWEPNVRDTYYSNQQRDLEIPFAPLPESFNSLTQIQEFFKK